MRHTDDKSDDARAATSDDHAEDESPNQPTDTESDDVGPDVPPISDFLATLEERELATDGGQPEDEEQPDAQTLIRSGEQADERSETARNEDENQPQSQQNQNTMNTTESESDREQTLQTIAAAVANEENPVLTDDRRRRLNINDANRDTVAEGRRDTDPVRYRIYEFDDVWMYTREARTADHGLVERVRGIGEPSFTAEGLDEGSFREEYETRLHYLDGTPEAGEDARGYSDELYEAADEYHRYLGEGDAVHHEAADGVAFATTGETLYIEHVGVARYPTLSELKRDLDLNDTEAEMVRAAMGAAVDVSQPEALQTDLMAEYRVEVEYDSSALLGDE